jgi:uncharacterized protein (DUF486 family)
MAGADRERSSNKYMRGVKTILFLFISNSFMTIAWYGHLKFKEFSWGKHLGLFTVILISWGLAFFEYLFQVPANRLGFREDGGPFSLVQLKTVQEAITLTVFTFFTLLFFKEEKLAWNHLVGFGLLVAAVFFIFKKW